MQGWKSYLIVAVILGGTIWLFWGKALQTGWKKATDSRPGHEQSTAAKIAKKLPEPLVKTKGPAVNAAQEWQKAQSGVTSLLSLQTQENRIGLLRQSENHEKRMIEILRAMKLLRDPAQAVKPAEAQPPKPVKPAERQRPKTAEPRPSKLRAIL